MYSKCNLSLLVHVLCIKLQFESQNLIKLNEPQYNEHFTITNTLWSQSVRYTEVLL